jgi:hypothetical protein
MTEGEREFLCGELEAYGLNEFLEHDYQSFTDPEFRRLRQKLVEASMAMARFLAAQYIGDLPVENVKE